MAKWNWDWNNNIADNMLNACNICKFITKQIKARSNNRQWAIGWPVISGGFLRDSFLGIVPKDIDVFIEQLEFDRIKDRHDMQRVDHDDYLYEHNFIKEVYNWNLAQVPYPIQLIVRSCSVSSEELGKFNDFGICRITYENGNLCFGEEFLNDVINKELTLYRTGWGQEGVQAHYDRLKQKFPDYTLVNKGDLIIV